jgi:CubicO group peptidase (beta-lactamase class C family)
VKKLFPEKKFSPALLSALILLLSALTGDTALAAPRGQSNEQREFASFVDGFMAGVRKERSIPGMAFVAVKDGEILYLKGYGTAGHEGNRAVDPEKTLFRAGAISQPVTAAAVMQLAERGRVGLDEDVNVYLRRWKLPGKFKNPITPRHLLTHTSGLDYKELEISAPTSSDERAYSSKLQKLMPGRTSEPGLYYCESGMGYALLGSIVERYSRLNFDAAIKKYIFAPLGMNNSAFTLTSGDVQNLSAGYGANGAEAPYEYRYDLPASGMSTTARDMGRFMIAALAGGAIGRNRILSDVYAGSMLKRHFSPNQAIDGACLGYLERPVSGLRTLQQYGDMPGFSSFLILIPEKNFGMFLAANASALDFGDELSKSVVDRFFPTSRDMAAVNPGITMEAYPDIEGYYRSNMISLLTAEKISKITADQINISIEGNYIAASHTKAGPLTTRWLLAPGSGDLFRIVGDDGKPGDEYMFFQRNGSGTVTALVMGNVGKTYGKLPAFESYYLQWAIISGFVTTALISFLGLFLGNSINKGKFPWEQGLSSDTELWGISSLFCAAQLLFVTGLAVSVFLVGGEFKTFVPYQVKALFVIPLAGGLLLAWFWFRMLAKLLSPDYHWLEKVLLMTMAFAETGYMFFLAHWRLLGFMF